MKKIIVVAKSTNNVIGVDNDLPWHLPGDEAFFLATIKGQYSLTGRKSFESAQGADIFYPETPVVIVTRRTDYQPPFGKVAHSIEAAFEIAQKDGAQKLMILGGAEIYRQTIGLADELIVTEVHTTIEGAAFFPEIDPAIWKEVSREDHAKDAANEFDYSFVKYRRN